MHFSDAIRKQLEECGARVCLGYPRLLRPFLRGYLGITLGRTVYLAPLLFDRGQEAVEATMRHELAHVRQILKLGLIRFYYRYAKEYLRGRLSRRTHRQAYDAISFEMEARAAAREEGFLV